MLPIGDDDAERRRWMGKRSMGLVAEVKIAIKGTGGRSFVWATDGGEKMVRNESDAR